MVNIQVAPSSGKSKLQHVQPDTFFVQICIAPILEIVYLSHEPKRKL